MKRTLILALIASLGLGACSKKDESAAQAPGQPGMAAVGQMQNQGRVIQVLQAGTYTYIEALVGNGEKVWMAGAHLDAKPGDPIQWGNASTMRNYQSKTLNRTFEALLFVEAWTNGTGGPATVAAHGTMPNGGAAGPGGHPPMAGAPTGHPPMGNAPVAAGGGNSGVVKSTTNAGGYSYVEVRQGAGTIWVAAPETTVKVGDKVTWDGGSVMQNFTARSLNRTFDQIVFAGGLNVVK